MATFNKFDVFTTDLCTKKHDLNADTLNVYLAAAATSPSASADSVKADIAEIATGNGYTGPVDTQNTGAGSAGTYTVTGTKVTITATGAVTQFRYVVLYNDTQTSPADPLIGWWDYASNVDLVNGETFTIKFNNGDPTGTILTVA
jgi:hypothetical protein